MSTQALDPAYAEAAARHGGDAQQQAGRKPGAGLALGLLAVTLLVVLSAVQAHRAAPAAARSRVSLLAEVNRESASVTALEGEVSRLRAETARLRDAALASTSVGAALTDHLDQEELAAGTVAVTGPGLRVVLDDAPASAAGQRNRVLDRDVQAVVNGLWAAGAEAIAIDGQRLTAQSAIRAAGQAILVDFQPVPAPYTISAIGDPVAMATAFGSSPVAGRMRSYQQLYGLRFSFARTARLVLPAASDLSVRYASPVPAPSASPRSHS
jgi:uncharacterized protein YlxW (UPF0749 family)